MAEATAPTVRPTRVPRQQVTAHTEMSQPFVWYGVGAQIRIGLPSNLLDQFRDHLSAVQLVFWIFTFRKMVNFFHEYS